MKKASNKNKSKTHMERFLSLFNGLSGSLSFLGGYQVCHNICLGVIAFLSLIGITFVGMPLLFLTKVAIPFWIAAVVLFGITLAFYFKNKCISKKLLIFNAGIIIAGVPFQPLRRFSLFFWLVGGALVALSIISLIKNIIVNRRKTAKNRKARMND